jgi:hypothetical protein
VICGGLPERASRKEDISIGRVCKRYGPVYGL